MLSAVLFFLFAAIVSYLIYRSIVHPVVVFNILWFVVITISTFFVEGLGYYKPSIYIYNIFLIGGVCYNVGAILSSVISSKRSNKTTIKEFQAISIDRVRLFTIAEIILAVYYFYKAINVANLLLSGQTYEVVRSIYFSDANITSPLEDISIMFIFDPLLLLTEVFFALNLFTHILPKKLNYLMLLNLALRTFLSAGRTAIFETGMLVLVSAIYLGLLKRASIKQKMGVFASIVTLFIFMSLITLRRHGGETGVIETGMISLVDYFTGSFPFFEDLLKSRDYIEPTYGLVTFGGVTDIFLHILRTLHLSDMPLTYISTGSILAEFRPIGYAAYYNAMPTMYYYFYTDFRELGYYICPLVFGYASAGLFRKIQQTGSLLSYTYYLFLMILVIESSFNWQLERIPFVMGMVYVYFYLHDKRRTKVSL